MSLHRVLRVLPSVLGSGWAASFDVLFHQRRCFNQGSHAGQPPRPGVWLQILQRASEDQEKLREIVRDLKIHCEQVHCAPPLDVYNELLRLSNYWHDQESFHKLVNLMGTRNMQVNGTTYAYLNEGFHYFPRSFPHSPPPPHGSSSSSDSDRGFQPQPHMRPGFGAGVSPSGPQPPQHSSTRHAAPNPMMSSSTPSSSVSSSTSGAQMQPLSWQPPTSTGQQAAGAPAAAPTAGPRVQQPRKPQQPQQQQPAQQQPQQEDTQHSVQPPGCNSNEA